MTHKTQSRSRQASWADKKYTNPGQHTQGLKTQIQHHVSRETAHGSQNQIVQQSLQADSEVNESYHNQRGRNYYHRKRQQKVQDPYGPIPMELDTTVDKRIKRGKKKDKHRGGCYYCRKSGHIAKNCRKKQADQKGKQLQTPNRCVQGGRNFTETKQVVKHDNENHHDLTWEECEHLQQSYRFDEAQKRQPLKLSECEFHWNKKMKTVKEINHSQHMEYPTFDCDCERHKEAQEEFKEWTRNEPDFMYHGDYGCAIKGCERCITLETSEEKEDWEILI